MKVDNIKPTKWQVLVPIIVLAVTLVLGGILLFSANCIQKGEESEVEFTIPGTQKLEVTKPGEYNIDIRLKGEYHGKTYDLPDAFDAVTLKIARGETQIAVDKHKRNVYGDKTRRGKTLFTFNADQVGTYNISGTIEDSQVTEVLFMLTRADSKGETMVMLATCGLFIILIGICQFIIYGVFNLVRWIIYKVKSN